MANLLGLFDGFRFPWVFLIPFFILLAGLLLRKRSAGVPHPSVGQLSAIAPSLRQLLRFPLIGSLSLLTLFALASGAARPQQVETLREPEVGRNLMLALDISKSMSAGDFGGPYGRATRLQAVKSVVAEFISDRAGDRMGIVVFGSNAYLQCPLTMDHSIVREMVGRLRTGLAGDGTAIGDGLGLALKRVEGIQADSRAVILLTDGVSNAGKVNPIQAARVARDLDVTVHTIGIGQRDGGISRLPRGLFLPGFGQQHEFDEETLREIAKITGGQYFHASNLESLKKVYEEIDKLEKSKRKEPAKKQVVELFPMYLQIGLAAYILCLLLARSVFQRIPS